MGILTDDMKRLVREQKLGFVATVCADGTPNLSPKGSTTVWDDDHLVFADLCSPGTIENLRHNQSVEINVVDPLVRKGYRFKGSASIFTEGPEFEKWLAATIFESWQTSSERNREWRAFHCAGEGRVLA